MEIRRRGNYICRDKNICGQPSTTRARRRNVEKVTSIKFHCRESEETKSSKMKFKSVLIVLLAVFVISTVIVETECQGRRRGVVGGSRGGDHLMDKVCNKENLVLYRPVENR